MKSSEVASVSDAFVAKLLERTFQRPRAWSDGCAEQYVMDLQDAVFRALINGSKPAKLAEFLEAVRKSIRLNAKTSAWPTVKEVIDALNELREPTTRQRNNMQSDQWPHCNSEFLISSTLEWIQKFGGWPHYINNGGEQVATEIINRGHHTLEELHKVGFRARN